LIMMGLRSPILQRLHLTPATIYFSIGIALGPSVFGAFHFNPLKQAHLLEVFAENAVLLSLFIAGMKTPVPVRWLEWRVPVRLAFLSMTISVALTAAFAYYALALPLGAAILLGGILAPTDPVLASDVQVRHMGDKDPLRFTLTSEAVMNDGSPFPFIMLGLAMLGAPASYENRKGENTETRIMEAAAIAAYQRQTRVPVVEILLADDAPQFKELTAQLALCWIHEGRHYNRLDPIVPCNVDALTDFKRGFWDFYGDLLKYKNDPNPEKAAKLSIAFDELFSTQTIYYALNDRIEKTRNKKEQLLMVLKYPWLPLHNNDSELGARVEKRRQDVSLQTKSTAGTTAKHAFLTITQTAKKLGVNAYRYIFDRVSKNFSVPSLSDLIVENALPQLE